MDELLLRRARNGDAGAFEALLTPLEGRIWRICWHYMGNREDASDCGQETMIRIWRNLGSWRGDCAFESWVYRIAANCCLDALRKKKRDKSVSMEPMAEQGFDPPDPSPGTEEQAVEAEERTQLRREIAELPEEQREALVLTQLEGMSYQDTAALLQVSEGTVKSRVNRAKARLKEWLSDSRELSRGRSVQQNEGEEKERRNRP
jgi:RNA polymerase sigma-70 factor (ECF subfamily)